jgi:hypothetical protein
MIPRISISQVAGITAVSHHAQPQTTEFLWIEVEVQAHQTGNSNNAC